VQLPIALLGLVLLAGSAASTLIDYSHIPAEEPLGIRLGRLYLVDDFWSVEEARSRTDQIGLPAMSSVFGPVLERNAASAYRWSDVGEALLAAGDQRRAEYCYLQAGKLAPHDPQALTNIGDFYRTVENPERAVASFSAVLGMTGAPAGDILTHNIFSWYEQMEVRANGLLEKAIPDAPNARAYLRYLMENADIDDVREVWDWLQEKRFDDDRLTLEYVDFLFRKKKFEFANEAWTKHFEDRKDGYTESSPVFNAGFEYESTNAMLDWRIAELNGLKVARDRGSVHAGQFSLRIDFSGNDNPDFHNVSELVFVRPGMYHFEGWLRTAAITSDQGIRFRIVAAQGSKPLTVETEALSGTNPWTRIEAVFEVPQRVRILDLQLARRRSIRIDNQLTGTAWIDAVRLTRLP
jgi:tetratricopeptide (TPR) repeat protein